MIRWFTKNHVAANLLMLGILISGIYVAVEKLGVEVEPAFRYNTIGIKINLQGGTPEDLEKQVILPIEKALEGTPGIKSIEADARRGRADIKVEADSYADLDDLKLEIESRIQRVNTFPQESEKPQVFIYDRSNWKEVITVAISGNFSEEQLLVAARKIRDDLQSKPGISKVSISATQNKEISIDLIPEKLNAYNLTFDDISKGIRQSSIDLSAGSIKEFGQNVAIRSSNKAYYGEQFSKLPVKNVNGSEILVEDVAVVRDSFEEGSMETLFNGRPAILIDVLRKNGENALDTSDIVHEYIAESRKSLPEGLYIDSWDDDSISLRGRIETLIWSLIQGGILVMIMLGLFLRPSVAFWVTIGIPVSFAGAALSMYLFGVTINNMSLFGFIIVLGIVVDDAIVTGENIFAKASSGKYSQLEAAIIGTKEVAVPVTFGVVTTMAAFIPLLLGDTYFDNIKKQIPFVVLPVLFFSLIESKFILPAHLKHLKSGKQNANFLTRIQDKIARSLEIFIEKVYQPFLHICIKFRYAVICAFIAILGITMSFFINKMESKSMPSVERYFLFAHLDMKQGTEVAVTKDRVNIIASAIKDIRSDFMDGDTGESLIRDIIEISGGSRRWGGNKEERGFVMVALTPPSQRSSENAVSNAEIVKAWDEKVGKIEGSAFFYIQGESTQGKHQEMGTGLEIQLRGNDDEAKALVAEKFEKWINDHPHLKSPYTSAQKPSRELRIRPKDTDSELTEQSLASQVRTAFNGTRIEKIQRGEDEINVMLRFPEEVRKSVHTLNTLRINVPGNKTAPLTQFADITETTTPPRIEREDGSRIMELRARVKSGNKVTDMEDEITAFMKETIASHPTVSWKYQGTLANHRKQQKETLVQLGAVMLLLFTLLAIPFKSFLQPLYVLLAVPFGIVGAIWGHYIMDMEITILSWIGVLALAGVVVNDSLVLVDYINKKRLEGMPLNKAVYTAGGRRFRPIILTSLTTFAGLMPLLSENSIQAQFLIPMAISLGFGILFATAITLLLIPCCYMVGEELKAYVVRFLRWFLMLDRKRPTT